MLFREPLKQVSICELPNEILVHILSFLTLKEVGRTSILSKRWIDMWKCIARLDFDVSAILDKLAKIADASNHRNQRVRKRETRKYVEWVNKVLESHRSHLGIGWIQGLF